MNRELMYEINLLLLSLKPLGSTPLTATVRPTPTNEAPKHSQNTPTASIRPISHSAPTAMISPVPTVAQHDSPQQQQQQQSASSNLPSFGNFRQTGRAVPQQQSVVPVQAISSGAGNTE